MPDLRIFSYLPNPRLAKALIAARFSGAEIEVVGDKPIELINWLWDYDARKLSEADKADLGDCAREAKVGFSGTLYKTDAFLAANPFGNVPAAFADDGRVGIFESNSIMRAAARCGPNAGGLLGEGPMGETRVDSFFDRLLVFARDAQRYVLAGPEVSDEVYNETETSLTSLAAGVEEALAHAAHLAGDEISLADIALACELCLFSYEFDFREKLEAAGREALLPSLAAFPRLGAHLARLSQDPRFSEDLGRYFDRLLPIWA